MRIINKITNACLIASLIAISSCNKDFLDTQPLGEVSSSAVWNDGPLATAFVNEIYNGLGAGGFEEEMLASYTDEAVFTHTGRGINTVTEGSASASNTGRLSGTYAWSSMYTRIRACNVALQNLETSTIDEALNERLQGEIHFLRAYYYHQLARYYGGVPLVTQVYGLDEDYTIARSSYAETIDFIVSECELAIGKLTGLSMQKGRATAVAAMALKSRVLLYAASDLHDIPTASAKSSVISGFANKELIGYTSGDQASRWQAAKVAARAVIDAASGYKFNLDAPVSAEEGRMNYISISMGGGSAAPGVDGTAASELLFARYNVPDKDEWGGPYAGLFNGPNGYHNWAGNTPIGELVDEYEMMDGTKFSWSSPAHKAAPYKNRDPRFYASIMFDGSDWKPRNLISGDVDPANQIQTGQYDLIVGGATITFQGLDTRRSSIEDWNGTRTGYYMRKFIDPDPAIVENNTKQFIPWPFFRYTEAVFNYVEACLELGEEEEARNWMNKIRFRAGMPAVTESGTALMDRYRNERRIEMLFEEQRYHDARRWMIAPTTLGRKIHFINVVGKFKPGKSLTGTYKHDESIYDYSYTPVEDINHENRSWADKMYFTPIHRDEMNKNDKLIQNPGYND
ncbi:RagB/SusD family nutrient uptake outer membrane protein [Flavihumibacter sp. ZG627]|uniref:RagB/SusD family nutrient uptake outer membrane protein n=1 Tax=Flavihumibacter sp. ZG627 TaxID=1463156 RepID=UPI00057FB209|nr:RagB/SusD family nutrient uptake outer membrane protein [Flavihumibacter sp. ZG627]KIC91127.1 carbohydrate-binding protein SusD [Flavihumibacter sp. ZG627]